MKNKWLEKKYKNEEDLKFAKNIRNQIKSGKLRGWIMERKKIAIERPSGKSYVKVVTNIYNTIDIMVTARGL